VTLINRTQISGVSKAGDEFWEGVASFESEAAGAMLAADQILDQQEFVK
jgi:hypothetical protein